MMHSHKEVYFQKTGYVEMVAVIREKSHLTINDETTKSTKNENPCAKQATLLSLSPDNTQKKTLHSHL